MPVQPVLTGTADAEYSHEQEPVPLRFQEAASAASEDRCRPTLPDDPGPAVDDYADDFNDQDDDRTAHMFPAASTATTAASMTMRTGLRSVLEGTAAAEHIQEQLRFQDQKPTR